MTATNHALTGAFIGLATGNPWLAIPAAFLSHFVLDAIPHYSPPGKSDVAIIQSKIFFHIQIIAGAILCLLVVSLLAALHPAHWIIAAACAFAATSPDLLSFPRYIHIKRTGNDNRSQFWFWRFHGIIQWFQKPVGAVVELAWAISMVILILPFLR